MLNGTLNSVQYQQKQSCLSGESWFASPMAFAVNSLIIEKIRRIIHIRVIILVIDLCMSQESSDIIKLLTDDWYSLCQLFVSLFVMDRPNSQVLVLLNSDLPQYLTY